MKEENMRLRDHEKEELSFYSKATTDIEYLFPFGWGELGALPTAQTMIWAATRRQAERALSILTPKPVKNIFPLLSNPVSAPTVLPLLIFARHTTKEVVDAKRTTAA